MATLSLPTDSEMSECQVEIPSLGITRLTYGCDSGKPDMGIEDVWVRRGVVVNDPSEYFL